MLPPLVVETVGRDVSDLVFERLADLSPGGAPVDPGAYQPRLAERWERVDSLSWRFHLAKDARWADGQPVTADDVVFSFNVFGDSVLDSPARPYIAGKVTAIAVDPTPVLIQFSESYPEQLYDGTYHVRILPRHVWSAIPREQWAADTSVARLVGSGPVPCHRVAARTVSPASPESEAGTARETAGGEIQEIVWRFAADPDAAVNLVLSHEADLMELAAAPQAADRVAADDSLEVKRYPSAAYGFLGFNLTDRDRNGPHPVLDRATRRALAMALDRTALATATFGPAAAAPPGPMSRLLWIWNDSIATLPFDTAAAAKALAAADWAGAPGRSAAGAASGWLRHPGARHQHHPPADCRRRSGGVARPRRRRDHQRGGFPGLSGAAGAGTVRQLHRRVAG